MSNQNMTGATIICLADSRKASSFSENTTSAAYRVSHHTVGDVDGPSIGVFDE